MKITIRHFSVFVVFAAVIFLFNACNPDNNTEPSPYDLVADQDAEVTQAWIGLFLEIDRYSKGYRPGPSARALAYINFAAYEACIKGMPGFKSLRELYPDLNLPAAVQKDDYHWPSVLNAVYATLFQKFFPSDAFLDGYADEYLFRIVELQQTFSETYREKVGGTIYQRSEDLGTAVANAVWDWSGEDSFGHNAYLNPNPSSYTPPTGPGLWQPTPPDYTPALFPSWGKVRTFTITAADKLANQPLTFSQLQTSPFYAQALAVRNAVDNLKFNEEWIAQFWSDDYPGLTFGPATRWISITSQVLEKENANLETALYTYAKVSIALNDATIAAFHSKYTYNVERPVSYINRVIDSDWQPATASTPAFPAYPSGHATMGAAAAEVLSHIFGYSYGMTDESHKGRQEFLGMPRAFASFYEMAEENALSRIYLGVHYQMDADEGLRMGFDIGRKVNEMPFK
ncbi:MAG: hypothetical protein CMN32_10660 [Saprospirales bacterium]|nr:hypothetical protein [Saprospirales bacterium]